jgi:hypothetical protein
MKRLFPLSLIFILSPKIFPMEEFGSPVYRSHSKVSYIFEEPKSNKMFCCIYAGGCCVGSILFGVAAALGTTMLLENNPNNTTDDFTAILFGLMAGAGAVLVSGAAGITGYCVYKKIKNVQSDETIHLTDNTLNE